jgi:uncharacterized protein YceK
MHKLVLALPLALVVAGCSGASTKTQPTAAPTTDAPTATPTTKAPSPTASPTASATPGATPTPSAVPTKRVPALDKDVDGDGRADAISATAGLLTVTLSSTGAMVTAPVHAESPGKPPVLGTADVDRDGRAEVFVQTAQGASTTFATPYRYDGTALREVQLDGGPARLGFGGSVTHGDGFRCLATGRLEVRQAESADGTNYTVRVDAYALTGASLVRKSSSSTKGGQGSPAVEASYTADCGSVGD